MRSVAFILLLSLACAAAGAGERLQYERLAVDRGEVWRIVTSNVAHWSWDQLAWDGIAFLLLGLVCSQRWPIRFQWTVAASALAIPLFVHFAMPQVATYRGLSGIDSALFALAAVRVMIEARRRERIVVAVFFAGFLAKIAFELITGSTLFVQELAPGVASLPVAHVIGAAIGIITGGLHVGPPLRRSRPPGEAALHYSPSFSRKLRSISSSAATLSSSRVTRADSGS